MDSAFAPDVRKKIEYIGIDISNEQGKNAERQAASLFKEARVEICELHRFEQFLKQSDEFDLVTFTNSAHEIRPPQLAETLVGALCRIAPSGCLFAYDMESLPELELGAIPWRAHEIQKVFNSILAAAGISDFPGVATYPHAACKCWLLQVHRDDLVIEPTALRLAKPTMIGSATTAIRDILRLKVDEVFFALQSLSAYGAESPDESDEIVRLLYDYFAISRSLGLPFALAGELSC